MQRDFMQIQKEIDVEDLSTLTKKHLKQICTNSLEEIDRISNSADNSPYKSPYKSSDSNYRQTLIEEFQKGFKDPNLKNLQNTNKSTPFETSNESAPFETSNEKQPMVINIELGKENTDDDEVILSDVDDESSAEKVKITVDKDDLKNELSDTDNEQYMKESEQYMKESDQYMKENKIEEVKNPTTTDEESLDMTYTQEVKKGYEEELQNINLEKDYNTGEFNVEDNSYNEGFSFSKENTLSSNLNVKLTKANDTDQENYKIGNIGYDDEFENYNNLAERSSNEVNNGTVSSKVDSKKNQENYENQGKFDWEVKEQSELYSSDALDSNTDYNKPENLFLNLKGKRINSLSSQQVIQYHQFIEKRAKNIFCELLKRKDLTNNQIQIVPGNEENYNSDQNSYNYDPYLASYKKESYKKEKKVFGEKEGSQRGYMQRSRR